MRVVVERGAIDRAVAPCRRAGFRSPSRCDRGAGIFGMAIGLLVFLIMLMFAVHLMLYLHLSAVASDAALAGAHALAVRTDVTSPAAKEAADARADILLGRARRDSWVGTADRQPDPDPDYVTYNVETEPLRLPAAQWAGAWASRPIVRSARVRIEAIR